MIRPQPLGIFPYPTGLLLLPDVGAAPTQRALAHQALAALLEGNTPADWPTAWHFFAAALHGDRDVAIASLMDATDSMAHYNRYVLTGDATHRDAAMADGDPYISRLTQMAAYIQGSTELPPETDGLDGELLAHGALVRATSLLEQGEVTGAMATLRLGIEAARATSPLLAAQLLSQCASLDPSSAQAESDWREALTLVKETPLASLRAELWSGLALTVHQRADANRGRLVEAVQHYQQALRTGITRERHPELWARIQANLGLAYVSMPMSEHGEKLRLAVAVQAFREALTVYARDTHPTEWASTMLNMANAMQYLPSAHQAENLADAVTAYEELLTVRPKEYDPVGYARILANQGNALVHLGVFGPAVEKLTEAHKLLHWHDEGEAAQRLLEQLEAINAQLPVESANGTA
jgi:tetratricopeptide (TPR) repeat protein